MIDSNDDDRIDYDELQGYLEEMEDGGWPAPLMKALSLLFTGTEHGLNDRLPGHAEALPVRDEL